MITQALTVKPVTSTQERPLVTIEFAPNIHPSETQYNYEHPLFVFGEKVELINSFPSIAYTTYALELIESKTPSGRLLSQPYWKYKISNGQVSYWREETALIRHIEKTCLTCARFQNYNDNNGKGWCHQFNHSAKTSYKKTNDCIVNGAKDKSNEAFPTEVFELDRDGYPMEEAAPTGYFSRNFTTNTDEPF
ncbi:MAG TPA: hypothetical protein V6C71_08740 [Coleofasciculaceae cyanobacterium]|jgi:hypothetical protein